MPSLEQTKLAFIGGGNMAIAIIGGLIAQGVPKQGIWVAEPCEVNRNRMATLGVHTTTSNVEAGGHADLVIIAVKPQVAKTVCEELVAAWLQRDTLPLVISIAAGITLETLKGCLQTNDRRVAHCVRVMPNTPALLRQGACGVFASADVTEPEKELVNTLLGSVNQVTEWVDKEELLDVVTGLSGSGPAYFFAMVEHLVASATTLGLQQEQAVRLATQTCLGAGTMLVASSNRPAQLRKNVTSPNGTTHAALQTFEALGFKDIVDKAVTAATNRAAEIGITLGKQ
ncbi:pyrroline-5-carboxylate reductase [Aspergillus nomiae NRRL 13137]|uniref:Pyrroline-5-carboxylate reductase n=1 Tax=Aspergillus nomiae NRRL (strain ATCC 15546 / NRRL 13137 / CBS 260.88 / M93) TaxID=1509407 RepID=A0A0L1IKU2_ASPN3|nr:pyrroline-5-carboxylate reductase [Aspergillus nomiae NRRL 13137]KNG80184.1 pyrroline-5-carboxylate reductase [Aspergillus nomiae NRRL 13137]